MNLRPLESQTPPLWRAALLLAVTLACQYSSAATPAAPDPRRAEVEAGLLPVAAPHERLGSRTGIRERMRAYGVPGLSVAVIDGGHLIWARGYGVADTRSGVAVTSDTLFQAASISKSLAAVGALSLVEHGRLRLDEDINGYLRDWKLQENDFTRAHPVTLRTLLDHSSGLSDQTFDNYSPAATLPGLTQVLQGHAATIHVDATPGSQHAYSNTGYVVLQQLIVDANGEPFAPFMQRVVLGPLGMTRSSYGVPAPGPRVAAGHYAGGEVVPGGYRVGPELAVAGLWSTPGDLAQFILGMQSGYAGSAAGVISAAMTREMLTPQSGYSGLGVVLSGEGEERRFGHDGFNTGFEAAIVGYVSHGQGAVVMTNSGFSYMLIREVLGSIARAYHWPDYRNTNQWPPSASLIQQEVTAVPRRALRAAPGRYELAGGTVVEVRARGERLYLEWPGDGEAEVFAVADGRYFCPQLTFSELGDPFLRFAYEGQSVTALLADQGEVSLQRLK